VLVVVNLRQGADAPRGSPGRKIPRVRGQLTPRAGPAGVSRRARCPSPSEKRVGARLAVDTDGSSPRITSSRRQHGSTCRRSRAPSRDASELVLATTPTAKAKSISWHVREVAQTRIPVRASSFTRYGRPCREALATAHDLDERLVRAQESRRILDRSLATPPPRCSGRRCRPASAPSRAERSASACWSSEEKRRGFRAVGVLDIEARIRRGDRAVHGPRSSASARRRVATARTSTLAEHQVREVRTR